jgi:hypothetical protein
MQNNGELVSEEEAECLPRFVWLFLAVAFVPHLLAIVGLDLMAMIASFICFPATMGPFALAHVYILVNRLGFISQMAWISALLFSLIWFALICWLWRKDKTVTLGICAFCFIISSGWIWLRILPLA